MRSFAGRLRQSITIESPSTSRDGRGQTTTSWSSVGTYRAHIRRLSGAEAERMSQIQPEATWQATMRHDPDLSLQTDYRLTYDGRTFQILSWRNVEERNRRIEIDLKEYPSS